MFSNDHVMIILFACRDARNDASNRRNFEISKADWGFYSKRSKKIFDYGIDIAQLLRVSYHTKDTHWRCSSNWRICTQIHSE